MVLVKNSMGPLVFAWGNGVRRLTVSVVLALLASVGAGHAQGSAFTYQGRLLDGGQPANGSYDLQFALTDAATSGSHLGAALTNAPVLVSNGLFTATLDFGGTVFDGSARWLEIGVRTNGSAGSYSVLSPRQALTATPYAVFTANAGSANVAASLTSGAAITVNGAGITNLNGANIQSGTVSSNALDAPTKAQLAMAGTGGSGIAVASGTNSVFWGSTSTRYFTVTNGNTTDFNTTASLLLQSPPSAEWAGFRMNGPNGDRGTMFYWPNHSGANGELLIEGVGATIALISDKCIQHGLEAWPMSEYYQHSALMHAANTNLGGNVPRQESAWVWINGTQKAFAGSLDISGDIVPTMYFDAVSTNGSGAWRWFGRGYCPIGSGANWTFNDELFRITAGPDAGVRVSKRFILEQAPQVTLRASSPAIALDFAKGQCTQITNATASSASFYLTNATGLSTNYEQRVFVIHSGPGLNITWPADWNWMNAAPANLSAGQLLRLQLESLGPYGSNVLASSSVGADMCYAPSVMDADASSFLGRMGGATAGVSNAINLFVTSLKADGTWTNFDALYPFMAANASGNAQNLISAANSMSWHGSFATMNATGIQSDGSTGYGDTGWKPSNSNNVGMFMFSSSNGAGGYALGARNDAGSAVFAASRSGNYYAFRLNNSQADSAVMSPTPDTSAPHVFYAGRYSTNSCHVYSGIDGIAASSTLSPARVPDYNVFICCVNDGDGVGPYAFWSAGCGCGLIQFVGLGQAALSQSQYQTLYNACVALNTDLGR